MSSLFGDLPSAKNSSKDNNHPNDSSISGNDHHHHDHDGSNASDKKDIHVATQERKQEIIQNDSISSSAASKKKSSMSFAFVPAALRTKKFSKQTNVVNKPKGGGGGGVAAATVQKVERTTLVSKADDDPTCTSRNFLTEEKDAEKDSSRDDDNDDREEEIRQLHLAVLEAEANMSEQKQRQANLSFDYSWIDKITPYDPMMPNDFLAYKEGQKKRRAREQLERNTRESLKRQEAMRERIEEERRKIEASGDIDAIVANREKHRREIHSVAEGGQAHSDIGGGRGRGRGRGLSNLPAWLVKKQENEKQNTNLAVQPSSLDHTESSTDSRLVLLTNMVGPGEVDDDLADEVSEECQRTCGRVLSVDVKESTADVKVFVLFASPAAASKSVKQFNGRVFGGRKVSAFLIKENVQINETTVNDWI